MPPAARSSSTDTVEIGALIDGKYRVEREVGTGGMGTVFAVTHVALNAQLAIKVLKRGALEMHGVSARFLREARAASRLRSDHVARVSDFGVLPSGLPYMVMELLDGNDLSQLIDIGPVPPEQAVEYILQACEALAEAHATGTYHRDIKPANLFLTKRAGQPWIKVVDFGIATASTADLDAGLTQTQTIIGSPMYMSPEQHKSPRDVDGRTDIWSLGVCLYEMLAGRPPFYDTVYGALLLKIAVEKHPPLPASVPAPIARVVDRCLAKHAVDRFDNIHDLALALARTTHSDEEATTIVGALPAPKRKIPWKKYWPFAAIGGALVAFVTIAMIVSSGDGMPKNKADHPVVVAPSIDAATAPVAPVAPRIDAAIAIAPPPIDALEAVAPVDATEEVVIEPDTHEPKKRPVKTPPVTPPPTTGDCSAATMAQLDADGRTAFSAGQDSVVLAKFDKLLACKFNDQIAMMATISACRSGNGARAKKLFALLPAARQQAVETRCAIFRVPLR